MMQMLEPDFWKGKGRYSKRANRKLEVDQTPISVKANDGDNPEASSRT